MELLIKGIPVLIDDEDYEKISSKNWYKVQGKNSEHVYFTTYGGFSNGRIRSIYLHKYLLGADNSVDVDHINLNTQDNRKSNLRICSHMQNCWNQKQRNNASGYKGVSKCVGSKSYFSRIRVGNRRIYLGCFHTAYEAYQAYCDATAVYHGEYARVK